MGREVCLVDVLAGAVPGRAASQGQGLSLLPTLSPSAPAETEDLKPGPEAEKEENWALKLDRKAQNPKGP